MPRLSVQQIAAMAADAKLPADQLLRLLLQPRRRRSHAIVELQPEPEKAEFYDWKRDEFVTESEYNKRFPSK